jgi:hypothetical protein
MTPIRVVALQAGNVFRLRNGRFRMLVVSCTVSASEGTVHVTYRVVSKNGECCQMPAEVTFFDVATVILEA